MFDAVSSSLPFQLFHCIQIIIQEADHEDKFKSHDSAMHVHPNKKQNTRKSTRTQHIELNLASKTKFHEVGTKFNQLEIMKQT